MRTPAALFGGLARRVLARVGHGGVSRGQSEASGPDAFAPARRGKRHASAVVWLCAVASVGLLSVGAPALATTATWSVVASPNTSSTQTNELHGVTCATSSDCWAVGFAGSGNGGTEQTLAEHWDGTAWSIVATPDASSSQNNLIGVTCTTSSDCWAVGTAVSSGTDLTLAEHWNGTAWAVVATPDAGILFGVTCTTTSDCWAVGNSGGQTLSEHWNGTAWSTVVTPNAGPLDGVTCTTSSDCWAVGNRAGQSLAEHWDGTAWSIVATPDTSSLQNDLFGVACTTSSDCSAVGFAGDGAGVQQSLAEHWNGTTWSIVATPTGNSVLLGVACLATSDCWAVGAGDSGIEHWDGTAWSIVAASNGPLNAVACIAGSDCWAVGFATNGTVNQTLVEHLVAAAPTLAVTPNNGPPGTPVSLTGTGFKSGETVTVSYRPAKERGHCLDGKPCDHERDQLIKTARPAGDRAKRIICTATATSNGTFTCNGKIPNSKRAGPEGAHKIVAKGASSHIKTKATFTLT
jgi:hypothetical protein